MEFNFVNKIDINAEKSILNESIIASQPNVEFNSQTESKFNIDFPEHEMMKNPFVDDTFKYQNEPIKSYNTFENKFQSESMSNISSVPTKMNFDTESISSNINQGESALSLSMPMTPTPVTGIPAEFKKITSSTDVFDEALKKSRGVQKQLENDVMPLIKEIGSQVKDMSAKQIDKKTLSEERPTVPPTNLIFLDRTTKTSSPPAWA